MRFVVEGPEDGPAGPDLDDGNRAQAEVEVPEVLHGQAQKGAYDHSEHASMADD